MNEYDRRIRNDESGGILLPILGSFISFAIVFALTFYFANGRSFKPGHLREQTKPDSQEVKIDSVALMRAQLDSLRHLVDSTAAVLKQVQAQIEQRRDELEALTSKLANAQSEAQQEILRRARRIASILAALPDSSVAAMAERLPDDLLVAVLQKSRKEEAAKLLGAVGPQRAAGLTRRLIDLN